MLNPYNYAGHLRALKDALRIPVIGSLNGVSPTGWVSYAQIIANAGADALNPAPVDGVGMRTRALMRWS